MSLNKTDEEWKVILTPLQYRILRKADTEPPFSGQYEKHHEEGTYLCAGCKTPLYESKTKFDSGCGWPAFYDAVPGTVVKRPDNSGGRSRTEILCSACGGHLGHVFKGENYPTPTNERHCVNSASLHFSASKKNSKK